MEDLIQVRGNQPWTTRRIILLTLTILAVVGAFFLLIRFRLVVFSLFEAIVFSTALSYPVQWLEKRKIPRSLGIGLTFGVIILLLVGFVVLTVPLLLGQGTVLAATVTGFYQSVHQAMANSPSTVLHNFAARLPEFLALTTPAPATTDGNLNTLNQALGYLVAAGNGLFATVAVLLLTFYYTLDREKTIRTLLYFVAPERRENILGIITATEFRVGAYLRGLAILSATIGLMSMVAYLIIGLPHVLLLGMIAGLLELIPLVGPILGAVPAGLVALSTDPNKLIYVIIAVVVIQFSENHFLVPRIMSKAVGVNPVVALLSFAGFSAFFGLAGALLAIPMAVMIQILIDRFILNPVEPPPVPVIGRDRVSRLRYETQELVADVHKQVRVKEGEIGDEADLVEDAIEAIATDLDSILAKAEEDTQGDSA